MGPHVASIAGARQAHRAALYVAAAGAFSEARAHFSAARACVPEEAGALAKGGLVGPALASW